MSIQALSKASSDEYSLKYNKKSKNLVAIKKKDITFLNRFKSIFGCGPLAHLDGSIKTLSAHLVTYDIESLKNNEKNAFKTIKRIANQAFVSDPKNDKLFTMVSKTRKIYVSLTIDISVSVGVGTQRIQENALDLGQVTYYKNSEMSTDCMHKQILKFKENLIARLFQNYPSLKTYTILCNSPYLWDKENNINKYQFKDLTKKKPLIIPIVALLGGFYVPPSSIGSFTLQVAEKETPESSGV